jgi:sphingomyelin phosphodiesterase
LQIRPGFRVIVLNTNYCARLNFWSLYNPIDPANHLKWLAQELLTAEQVGDSVHIVSHVVPDKKECTQAWLYNYLAIVERFKDTIVAQFYGHTHADEFRVLYSNNNFSEPIGYQFVSPSLSTYDAHNPAYRVFKTDPKGKDFAKKWEKTIILF